MDMHELMFKYGWVAMLVLSALWVAVILGVLGLLALALLRYLGVF